MTYLLTIAFIIVLIPLACANGYLYFSGRGSFINIFAAVTCTVAAVLLIR